MLSIAKTFLNIAKNPIFIVDILFLIAISWHYFTVKSLKSDLDELRTDLESKERTIQNFRVATKNNLNTIESLKKELKGKDEDFEIMKSGFETNINKLRDIILSRPNPQNIVKTEYIIKDCSIKFLSKEDLNGTDVIINGIQSIGF